ncbi:hypothetical protein evm_012666 [Chilo suppressalis]|nr:hypothetical protein evm_012666 [Chilo suppressalis]
MLHSCSKKRVILIFKIVHTDPRERFPEFLAHLQLIFLTPSSSWCSYKTTEKSAKQFNRFHPTGGPIRESNNDGCFHLRRSKNLHLQHLPLLRITAIDLHQLVVLKWLEDHSGFFPLTLPHPRLITRVAQYTFGPNVVHYYYSAPLPAPHPSPIVQVMECITNRCYNGTLFYTVLTDVSSSEGLSSSVNSTSAAPVAATSLVEIEASIFAEVEQAACRCEFVLKWLDNHTGYFPPLPPKPKLITRAAQYTFGPSEVHYFYSAPLPAPHPPRDIVLPYIVPVPFCILPMVPVRVPLQNRT